MPRVPITDEIREELRAHRERTGIGPHALATSINARPKFVLGLFEGKNKTADLDELNAVLESYRSLPDAPPLASIDDLPSTESKRPQYPKRKQRPKNVPIPPAFNHHLERTGINKKTLWGFMPLDLRPDSSVLTQWGTKTKSTRKEWLEAAMHVLESLPDKRPTSPPQPTLRQKEEYIEITEDLRGFIAHHKERTGLTYEELAGEKPPCGLDRYILSNWMSSNTKSARAEQVDYIKNRLPTLPAKNAG